MSQENKKILFAPDGSSRPRKRVGRGQGSGNGCTAGRGNKGAKSRSGYSRKLGFEGGQMPLIRRIPKSGFTNAPFKKKIVSINVSELERFGADEISKELLIKNKILTSQDDGVKLLSRGDVKKAYIVHVDYASKNAIEKIEKAGGKVVLSEKKKWVREKTKKS